MASFGKATDDYYFSPRFYRFGISDRQLVFPPVLAGYQGYFVPGFRWILSNRRHHARLSSFFCTSGRGKSVDLHCPDGWFSDDPRRNPAKELLASLARCWSYTQPTRMPCAESRGVICIDGC